MQVPPFQSPEVTQVCRKYFCGPGLESSVDGLSRPLKRVRLSKTNEPKQKLAAPSSLVASVLSLLGFEDKTGLEGLSKMAV